MTAVPIPDCITPLADSGPRGWGCAFEASLEACMWETSPGFRYDALSHPLPRPLQGYSGHILPADMSIPSPAILALSDRGQANFHAVVTTSGLRRSKKFVGVML